MRTFYECSECHELYAEALEALLIVTPETRAVNGAPVFQPVGEYKQFCDDCKGKLGLVDVGEA